jgi:hypothetical protein
MKILAARSQSDKYMLPLCTLPINEVELKYAKQSGRVSEANGSWLVVLVAVV